MQKYLPVVLLILLAACVPAAPAAVQTLPADTATATQPPTLAPTALPALTATPDPYYSWSNDYLRSRTYGGGQIEFLEVKIKMRSSPAI